MGKSRFGKANNFVRFYSGWFWSGKSDAVISFAWYRTNNLIEVVVINNIVMAVDFSGNVAAWRANWRICKRHIPSFQIFSNPDAGGALQISDADRSGNSSPAGSSCVKGFPIQVTDTSESIVAAICAITHASTGGAVSQTNMVAWKFMNS